MNEHWLFIKRTFSLRRSWNAAVNWLSFVLSNLLGRPIVWGLPTVVMIEPTNICNLKCPLCPTGAGTMLRPGSFMELDLFKKVVDDVWRDTFMILMWNQGESFKNKHFIEMTRYASDHGLWTYGSTNGHYLSDPEAVVNSGLGTLLISVDGASATTYEAYRRSGNFDQVIVGMKGLVAAKKRLGSATPVIHLQFIIMRHNEHEIPQITKLAQDCGVDRLTLKTVQIYDDADIDIWLPENMAQSRYEVSEDADGKHFALKGGYKNQCIKLWNQPVVNAGGEFAVCCFDKDVDFPMGNMKTQSFREIWQGPAYQQFRQALMKDRGALEMCRNCGEGVKVNHDQQDICVDLKRDVELTESVSQEQQEQLASSISENIERTLAREQEKMREQKLQAAKASRPRNTGTRATRRAERTGVAGLSMGQGPRAQQELRGEHDSPAGSESSRD